MSYELNEPENPLYGTGTFRRRIHFVRNDQTAQISLFDDYHDMDLSISIAAARVTGISGEMRRYPKTTCRGAIAGLNALVGTPVSDAMAGALRMPAHEQCTHLRDLAGLCLSSVARNGPDYLAEISVTDKDDNERQEIVIEIDGKSRFCLVLINNIIVEPETASGKSIFGGLGKWVAQNFVGLEADFWRMAQIAVFVARGRRWIVDGPDRSRVGDEPHREGSCYSFSRPSYPDALSMMGYVRDHSCGLPPPRL